ncbi:MAG: hypothetical protein ACE5KZ_07810 [Candidatus Scalinduaceae bacterium]
MDELLKKLDDIMTKDFVRKIGGLFCVLIFILSVAAFLVCAGSLLSSINKKEVPVEATAEEAHEEEGVAEEAEEEAAETTEEEAEE